MNKPLTLNVRIGGALSDFVSANVGEHGSYENVSEYVRDLIRRDKERVEAGQFERLKAELTRAFAADEASFAVLDAGSVIARNARN
ncbi:addiction module antitoxin [Sphingomonas sp. DBB INV C78]|uniref:ribbon-helix-helix domain-containing protein n=1 Tax=Sphingomonas sp. DBB INV C78 TaxID=3349434 RepID=UPI0036D3F057